MADTTYGTGTALQFTDASQRQVLELGDKIHYYNPEVTPIFTLFGMGKSVTPVPIFEWMEDEYMIKRSTTVDVDVLSVGVSTQVLDSSVTGENDTGCIIQMNRQAQVELFEKGGLYELTVTGGVALTSGLTHAMCIAIGEQCSIASADHRNVQFVGFDALTAGVATYDEVATTDALFTGATGSAVGTLSFDYVGTVQEMSVGGIYGYTATQTNLTDDNTADVVSLGGHAEGAGVSLETRKAVRRLSNCTQIFREPYTITNTAKASEHYGGDELSRLQARKLAKIKVDIEYALLTNGAISLDATAENPKRTFQGIGIGSAGAGAIKTNNGDTNTNLQYSEGSGTTVLWEGLMKYLFDDMVSGSMKKTVFCSNRWMVALSAIIRATANSSSEYGMGSEVRGGVRVRNYLGPVGELEFVQHPLLQGSNDVYAVAVDPSNFNIRPLNSRDMQLRPDIVKDGRDGQTDEWLMEMGMELRNEQTHAILKLVA